MSTNIIYRHRATSRHDRDWEIEILDSGSGVRVSMEPHSRVFAWEEVAEIEPVFEEFDFIPVRAFRGLVEKLGQLAHQQSQS